jgi:tetratricopeptide (TPR) repeat protein
MPAKDESLSWKNRGDAYVTKEQYDYAIGCYEYAVHLDRDNLAAWNNLGCSLYKVGKKEDAYRVKKILEDHRLKQERELKSSRASVFTSDILLFFVFLATVWGILLVYWLYFWGGTDLKIGVAWAGVLAFIIVGWIWAFFLLWDTENNICRFFALLITGFVFGGAIVLSRILLRKFIPSVSKEGRVDTDYNRE